MILIPVFNFIYALTALLRGLSLKVIGISLDGTSGGDNAGVKFNTSRSRFLRNLFLQKVQDLVESTTLGESWSWGNSTVDGDTYISALFTDGRSPIEPPPFLDLFGLSPSNTTRY